MTEVYSVLRRVEAKLMKDLEELRRVNTVPEAANCPVVSRDQFARLIDKREQMLSSVRAQIRSY